MATARKTLPRIAPAEPIDPSDAVFDLEVEETLLAEEAQELGPFTANIRGRVITLIDARELDWQELYEVDHPAALVEKCIAPEDKRWFLQQKISGKALNVLFERYRDHYGIRAPRR